MTISSEGRLNANVHARTITVQGQVDGDLCGEEQVMLKPSCKVRGNISAARVALEDGANFQGTINMAAKSARPPVNPGGDTASAAAPAPGDSAKVSSTKDGAENKKT